ncbi:hypothetical protein [Ekhidna sp.]|uniref:hypothetical protein n=1 Tax=Ekhidna sp. TaxID=2608089 RepID=UPI003B512E53
MTRSTFFNRHLIVFVVASILTAVLIGNLITGTSGTSILLRLFLILSTQTMITIFFFANVRKRNKQNQEQQNERSKDIAQETKSNWWKDGLFFGGFLYLSLTIILPLVFATEYDIYIFLNTLPVTIIAGLFFGLGMKLIDGKKESNKR